MDVGDFGAVVLWHIQHGMSSASHDESLSRVSIEMSECLEGLFMPEVEGFGDDKQTGVVAGFLTFFPFPSADGGALIGFHCGVTSCCPEVMICVGALMV